MASVKPKGKQQSEQRNSSLSNQKESKKGQRVQEKVSNGDKNSTKVKKVNKQAEKEEHANVQNEQGVAGPEQEQENQDQMQKPTINQVAENKTENLQNKPSEELPAPPVKKGRGKSKSKSTSKPTLKTVKQIEPSEKMEEEKQCPENGNIKDQGEEPSAKPDTQKIVEENVKLQEDNPTIQAKPVEQGQKDNKKKVETAQDKKVMNVKGGKRGRKKVVPEEMDKDFEDSLEPKPKSYRAIKKKQTTSQENNHQPENNQQIETEHKEVQNMQPDKEIMPEPNPKNEQEEGNHKQNTVDDQPNMDEESEKQEKDPDQKPDSQILNSLKEELKQQKQSREKKPSKGVAPKVESNEPKLRKTRSRIQRNSSPQNEKVKMELANDNEDDEDGEQVKAKPQLSLVKDKLGQIISFKVEDGYSKLTLRKDKEEKVYDFDEVLYADPTKVAIFMLNLYIKK